MESEEKQKFDIKAFAAELRDDIEKNNVRLPTLPAISLEALLVVNDAGSSMADVARIIGKDTSMAARIVRYANSPLYRGINTVTSVKSAITRIGIDAVKHAILSLAMRDVFTTAYLQIQSRMEKLWKHSVSVASKAAMIAGNMPHLNKDEAMLAGLIHDVGVIPILIKSTEHQILLEKESNLDKVVQMLHMPIGRFMLSHWSFDPAMVDVAANHDNLERKPLGEQVDYVDIVQVANILSHQDAGDKYLEVELEKTQAYARIGKPIMDKLFASEEGKEEEQEISVMLH